MLLLLLSNSFRVVDKKTIRTSFEREEEKRMYDVVVVCGDRS
jgi:hypothetical protein